jgi:sRNA-binding carbon storage regulator CsrA
MIEIRSLFSFPCIVIELGAVHAARCERLNCKERKMSINKNGWLGLTRHPGESILIGPHFELFVVGISPPNVRLELFTRNADGSLNMSDAALVHCTLNQTVALRPDIELFVTTLRPREVRLAIRAPESLQIIRAELLAPERGTAARVNDPPGYRGA